MYTALEIGRQIKSGEQSVREVVEAALKAIETRDGAINAFITVTDRESLLSRAAEVQQGIDSGILNSPLAGVPIGIKDNICTKDQRTTAASKMLEHFIPPYSATAVERLEAAGMIVVGKLNLDEFAMGCTTETSYFGPVKNPWDQSRVPGGSSGGSAAVIAAGEIPVSLGSDTGGSIRQPASYCGVTGFKPTHGVVSRYGGIAYASSLDQIGPLGRDVADCAALLDIMKGRDPLDGTSLNLPEISYLTGLTGDIRGKRIALPKEYFSHGTDGDIKENLLRAAETLRSLGAIVEEVSLPCIDYVIPTYYILSTAEAGSNLARFDGVKYGFRAENTTGGIEGLYRATRGEGFGQEVQKRILLGSYVLSAGCYDAYYNKALRVKALIKGQFDGLFENYDAILGPVTPDLAPRLGESATDPEKRFHTDIFTAAANLAGLPALALPCGFDRDGMPIGAQLMGQRLTDDLILNLGHAFQMATDYHKQSPREGGAA